MSYAGFIAGDPTTPRGTESRTLHDARKAFFRPMAEFLTEVRNAKLPLKHHSVYPLRIKERKGLETHPLELEVVLDNFKLHEPALYVTVSREQPFAFEIAPFTYVQGPKLPVRFSSFEVAQNAILGWIAKFVDPTWAETDG